MTNPQAIQKMFGAIAPKYDCANAFLSLNLHKIWNRKLVNKASTHNPTILLDLCAGTGEIAYLWLKKAQSKKAAILLDFCPEMLKIAKDRKPQGHQISFLTADAQAIPMPNSTVDAITIAYGIRNVKNPDKCFQEAFRVLRPGGTFAILELTQPNNRLLRIGHKLYLEKILPILGGILTRKPDAYRYLSTSIQSFVKPAELIHSLSQAGFHTIQATPLTFGVAHIITAKK